jgi:hypothetical protein
MKLSEGNLYVVKKDKDWIIAMFTGYEVGRARGVDWRWAVFVGPLGTFRTPASDTFLICHEIDEHTEKK